MVTDDDLPTVEDVHAVHDRIVEVWDLDHRGTSAVYPDRTVASVLEAAAEEDDEYRRAATLLRRLANAHVYEDGNKRTAWVVASTYLRRRGTTVAPAGKRAATVMRHFKRFDVNELATWLQTGEIDDSRLRDE